MNKIRAVFAALRAVKGVFRAFSSAFCTLFVAHCCRSAVRRRRTGECCRVSSSQLYLQYAPNRHNSTQTGRDSGNVECPGLKGPLSRHLVQGHEYPCSLQRQESGTGADGRMRGGIYSGFLVQNGGRSSWPGLRCGLLDWFASVSKGFCGNEICSGDVSIP